MIRIIVNGVNRFHIDMAFDFNDIFNYTPQRFRLAELNEQGRPLVDLLMVTGNYVDYNVGEVVIDPLEYKRRGVQSALTGYVPTGRRYDEVII